MRRVEAIPARLSAAGATELQARRVLRGWLRGEALDARAEARDAPFGRRLRTELDALGSELEALARPAEVVRDADGSERIGLELWDGARVEAVRLPSGSVCLSTQVGCGVGCRFCWTGREGARRGLSGPEILAQLAALARRGPVRRVLFMGMGEPAHNPHAVLDAARSMCTWAEVGRRDVVVSTVGDRRLLETLERGPFRPALALSLHTTDDGLRAELLPRAPRVPVAELVERADAYARSCGQPTQLQWTLLGGVNDRDEDLTACAPLLAGTRTVLNLIPWNPVPGSSFERPSDARCRRAVRVLMRSGVFAKLRMSAGLEARAACGQLAARG